MKCLKEKIRAWIKTKNENSYIQKKNLKTDLAEIDLLLDKGEGDYDILNKRVYVSKSLQDIEKLESMEVAQKAKSKWVIKGDENSKYYHGVLNKKKSTCCSCDSNIETIVHVLECFHRASGLRINMNKSKIMGISVAKFTVEQASTKIGCAILTVSFSYLGSKVGDLMSQSKAWNDIINKLTAGLSKWKMKTLSIGGD
nr:RNA-directed DNA polymerase, eukaryota [Tanacetum cinerariifolium]